MKNMLMLSLGAALLITAGCASTPAPTPASAWQPVPPMPPIPPNRSVETVPRHSFAAQRLSPPSTSAVNLTWNASPDASVVTNGGYNIYMGTSSGVYTSEFNLGNVLAFTVSNLTRGVTYYFAATAWVTNTGGTNLLESAYSNEASYQPTAVPGPPGNLNLIIVALTAPSADGPWYARSILPAPNVGSTGYFRLAASSSEVMTLWASTLQGPWQPCLYGPSFDQPLGYTRLDLRRAY